MPRPLGPKSLQNRLERSLIKLLRGDKDKPVDKQMSKEDRDEMRQNINAATKFLAVKNKLKDSDWGSGFGKPNGEAKGEDDDGQLGDED